MIIVLNFNMASLKNVELSKSPTQNKNTSLQMLQGYGSDSDSTDETDESNHNIVMHTESVLTECLNVPITNNFDESNKSNVLNCSLMANIENSNLSHLENFSTSENTQPGKSNSTIMNDLDLKNNMIISNQYVSVDPTIPEDEMVSECHKNLDNAMIENDNSAIVMDYEIQNLADDKGSEPGVSSSDSDSDSSSDWESLKGVEECSESEDEATAKNFKTKKILKVKGELGLEDLPPIQDLTISVPNKECLLIGTVYDIVDQLVIVESLPNKPALDIDTILFMDEGSQSLGKIFDVFGQVTKPFYCVRFNSKDHIKEKGIDFGMSIYCAPKTEHTQLVFVSELMRLKGSDASWRDDHEPPIQFLEFSDDEEEKRAQKLLKEQKKKANTIAEERGETSSTQKRYKPSEFEQRMNRKNLQKTAECNRLGNQNNCFNTRNGNPFSRRTNNSNVQWGPNVTFIAGGNPFDFARQGMAMGAPFAAFPPGMCGRPLPPGCAPMPPLPPGCGPPPPPGCALPTFMRPPRFTAPPPSLPAHGPLWFMNRPPSAPPGT